MSDFKLGRGVIIKGAKDWTGTGRPQVVMHCNCQCHIFQLYMGCTSNKSSCHI